MYKQFKISWSIIVGLTAAMLVVPLAYAVFVTINTDNDSVDTTVWNTTNPSPYLSDGDNDGTVDDDMEISAAYVGTSGADGTDYLYFRVDTIAGPSASDSSSQRLNAFIDCDNDNDLTDTDDMFVSYIPTDDSVEVFQTNPLTRVLVKAATDGEQPTGATNSNEWQVLKSDLDDYGCTNILSGDVQFGFNTSDSGTDVDDIGPGASWNSPTAVSLQTFSSEESNLSRWLLFALVLIVTTGAFFYWRRRQAA